MTRRNYRAWKDKYDSKEEEREAVLAAINDEWQSQSDIAHKIGRKTTAIGRAMYWVRNTQSLSVAVQERINKPTLYRRKK